MRKRGFSLAISVVTPTPSTDRAANRARGATATENFITIAYLVCGKLNSQLPT